MATEAVTYSCRCVLKMMPKVDEMETLPLRQDVTSHMLAGLYDHFGNPETTKRTRALREL